jgi:prolyl oligopeptidase
VEVFRGEREDGGYGVQPMEFVDGSGHHLTVIERPLSTFESEYYVVAGGRVQRLALPARLGLEALVAGQLVLGLHQDWEPSPGQHFSQGSLVALDARALEADPRHPKPVAVFVPGPREAFEASGATRDALLVTSLDNVSGRAALYRPDGKGGWTHTPLPVPPLSTVSITSTDLHGDHAYLSVSGFLQPTRLLLLDVRTAALHESRSLPPKFDASGLVVEQFAATSSDGTQVPYFMVHRAGLKPDGNNPTIIDAYGGFLISNTPTYAANLGKLWLERGGVFVLANIRGGGEFGPAWHDAGLKTRRQLIYDDFTAVARDLFARGITSARRLGIQGGSNGGLLMGVQFTQHPEMWNAVDIQVPLLDMLRYEQIQAGSSWVGEYGSVSVPEERAFLASISPYANIRRDRNYPEPLVWTTTKDDRVGPQHARKFAARLKEYGLPYLFYEATEGGHGSGANLNERAHTTALEFTYFARKLMD